MKPLSVFSGLTAQVLLGGAFLAIFLAGPSSQPQAADPSPNVQNQEIDASAALAKIKAERLAKEGNKIPEKPMPCDDPPGTCNSMNLNSPLPDPTGCTSGSKCSIEGKVCNPGRKCKTVGAPGQCYCACM
jgi:hypothetical protein